LHAQRHHLVRAFQRADLAGRSQLRAAVNLLTALADISFAQLALIAGMALVAATIGGIAGYGTGALMPLVLVPIVGAEPVVPIIAISALLTNASRATVFRPLIDWRRAGIVVAAAVPTCVLGALGYTLLTGRGAMLVIGTMMMASVPLRWLLRHHGFHLRQRGLAAAAFGWGFVVGGTTGAGAILLALLMAAGLQGGAVIATDAAISIAMGLTKLAVFGFAGVVTAQVIAIALLIGGIAFPGTYLAKWLVSHLPLHLHTAILDGVVIIGGSVMIYGAFTR
jgi:uncharacterized membrane protein YfcA